MLVWKNIVEDEGDFHMLGRKDSEGSFSPSLENSIINSSIVFGKNVTKEGNSYFVVM